MGLLFLAFRRVERWLHQHIFKVGWLLTNNFQITTILYYSLFLPGIVLHELCVWLLAGLLRVRAERAISFPAAQEIGELRLNFIRLSPQAGRIRIVIISLTPLAAGIVALWLLAEGVFRWQTALAPLDAGGIDALATALQTVVRTADFWLWVYLAFVIANTMFPALPLLQSWWHKAAAAIALLLLAYLARTLDSAFSLALLESLAVALLQVLAFNLLVVAVLGTVESLIERVTGKSASFVDGKMIAMSREEALAWRAEQRRASASSRPQPKPKAFRTIYDFPLPIPGPPGREPVSRRAVTVLMPSAPEEPAPPAEQPTQPPSIDAIRASEAVPFSRPFVPGDALIDDEPWQDEADDNGDAGFARPFSSADEHSAPPEKHSEPSKPPSQDLSPLPAPKPKPAPSASPRAPDSEELSYEPIDDVDSYLDDDGRYYEDES
ncbi:MAG: hypothetical protein OXE46_02200 [Chloroflexi bacterium]|nr:hypothetical protein [Chloroflexota bacterium]